MSVQGVTRFESSISEVPTKPENQEDSLGRSLSDYYMVLDWDSRTLPRRRIHYRPDAGAFLRSLGDASVLGSSHHKPRTGAVVRRDWWNLDVGSRGAVLHPDDPALRLPVRIADCICTGLRKHSGRIRYRDGVLQTVCPVGRPPAPRCDGPQGIRLDLRWGALTPGTAFLKYLVAASLPLVALFITWKTFKYATPLTAKVVGGATKGAALVGGVAAGAYVGGAGVATTAARWGQSRRWPRRRAKAAARGGHGADDSGAPSYRRTENDPGGATAESTSDGRGMDFDRGIH